MTRFSAIAEPGTLTGNTSVSGEGKALAPGFIDIHSHADMPVLVDGRAHSLITQGITTIVPGNCGGGASPTVSGATVRQSRAEWLADIGDFSTFPAYIDRVRERGAGVNVLPLVPHGMLRGLVAGMDTRELTPQEVATMSGLVAEAMDAGAVGLSSGLEYSPGIAATTAELAAIAVPVGERGGFYATHCRNRSDRIVEAAEEAVLNPAFVPWAIETARYLSQGRHRPSDFTLPDVPTGVEPVPGVQSIGAGLPAAARPAKSAAWPSMSIYANRTRRGPPPRSSRRASRG